MLRGDSLPRGPNAVRIGSPRREGAGRNRPSATADTGSEPDVYGRTQHGPSQEAVVLTGASCNKAGAATAPIGISAESMGAAALATRVSGADETPSRLRSGDRPKSGKRRATGAGIAGHSEDCSVGV